MRNVNPRNFVAPRDQNYRGRKDYQGNHDVFEMPEDQKPSGRRMPSIPLGKIGIVVIVLGVIALVVLVSVSMLQQAAFVQ